MNPVIKKMMEHRSIRKFKEDEVTKQQIETIIQAAQMAPSSSFMQSYSIIGITDPAIKKELGKITESEYVEKNGHFFIFCADLYRLTVLASAEDKKEMEEMLESTLFYQISVQDTSLAAQNALLAAESMGLGGVIIGGIVKELPKLDKILQLPPYVIPLFGLAIGVPDQQPEIKPRLPMTSVYFENAYKTDSLHQLIEEYDQRMNEYYQTRTENNRIGTWSSKNIEMFKMKTPVEFFSQYVKEKNMNKN
ncbi:MULTISPECIES: oxygen-insensitive NADPH nitroreductase [Bacillus]|uniref:NADPH-dependent oxidoreductase n=2 Tax=Bacillus TaxID=1386 RepID=A0A0M4FVT6_9BACI|nr:MULTISPECIES: oxygen-insensitive NADPH nitroreductase [Bacillus]ALC84234.1 NADPH-dependent oxidoreductase [Bacillus gobiensis]MBP1081234.1 FMN reductase (NADPH) [Bacillus capparidis]MED1095914.1 oxygen-insensitive NADPH nitroreductase [Bacillus capparidis]